jgi:hypothetical protein
MGWMEGVCGERPAVDALGFDERQGLLALNELHLASKGFGMPSLPIIHTEGAIEIDGQGGIPGCRLRRS